MFTHEIQTLDILATAEIRFPTTKRDGGSQHTSCPLATVSGAQMQLAVTQQWRPDITSRSQGPPWLCTDLPLGSVFRESSWNYMTSQVTFCLVFCDIRLLGDFYGWLYPLLENSLHST